MNVPSGAPSAVALVSPATTMASERPRWSGDPSDAPADGGRRRADHGRAQAGEHAARQHEFDARRQGTHEVAENEDREAGEQEALARRVCGQCGDDRREQRLAQRVERDQLPSQRHGHAERDGHLGQHASDDEVAGAHREHAAGQNEEAFVHVSSSEPLEPVEHFTEDWIPCRAIFA